MPEKNKQVFSSELHNILSNALSEQAETYEKQLNILTKQVKALTLQIVVLNRDAIEQEKAQKSMADFVMMLEASSNKQTELMTSLQSLFNKNRS